MFKAILFLFIRSLFLSQLNEISICYAWVKVYEIVKTENWLKAGNYLYFICKYYSFFFQNGILF